MCAFILSLPDPLATLETVGGKGVSLSKLAREGLPVPGGFHVTTDAYKQFVAENELQPKILDALRSVDITISASLEAASQAIHECFEHCQIPAEICAAIVDAYQALDDHHAVVAVRSSATAEDLPGASFAGQQETYLNIHGVDALLNAVKNCWASLWTARAIAYRIKNNIDQSTVALAVVVQKLVFANAAGVMFTANPINGNRDETVINTAWGLGEAIVSGAVTPDTITVDKKKGKVTRRVTAEKSVMTVRTDQGTQEEPVPDAQKRKEVLTNAQAAALARYGVQIETLYGMPMDIEWALAEGQFAIVQARPITSLPPEWKMPNPKGTYARSSLAEHLPNAACSLFGTLGLRAVNQATAELAEMMNMDLREAEYQYRVINGYVYMGFLMTWKFMWTMVRTTFDSFRILFTHSKERWQQARRVLADVIAKWDGNNPENMIPSELLTGAYEVMYAAAKYYTVIQSSTLPTATVSEILFTRLYNAINHNKGPKAETLLFGLDTVPLRAEKSLFDLAMWVRSCAALCDFIQHSSTVEIMATLQKDACPDRIPEQQWQALKTRLEEHASTFGHTSFEFDFMNPTPAETPALILDTVKVYVEGKGSDPYKRQREVAESRDRAIRDIQKRFKLIPNRWFNKAFRWAMDSGPVREDSLADMGMGHTTIRRLLGELGSRFVRSGALQNASDIYWLNEDEVTELASLLERNMKLPDYVDTARNREAEWQTQMKLLPPPVLPFNSPWSKMVPARSQSGESNRLEGVGASAGKVTARACVLLTPDDFGKMQPGDVLVAVTTTPAWTPLFAMASAVVTDIGGPLSHSSIVAREYGIPAVLATGMATRRIQDGQTITVDGSAGTVELK